MAIEAFMRYRRGASTWFYYYLRLIEKWVLDTKFTRMLPDKQETHYRSSISATHMDGYGSTWMLWCARYWLFLRCSD